MPRHYARRADCGRTGAATLQSRCDISDGIPREFQGKVTFCLLSLEILIKDNLLGTSGQSLVRTLAGSSSGQLSTKRVEFSVEEFQ